MSKLPVVSGAECVKALGKVGLSFIDNGEVTSLWSERRRPPKPPFPITKSLIEERCAQLFGKRA